MRERRAYSEEKNVGMKTVGKCQKRGGRCKTISARSNFVPVAEISGFECLFLDEQMCVEKQCWFQVAVLVTCAGLDGDDGGGVEQRGQSRGSSTDGGLSKTTGTQTAQNVHLAQSKLIPAHLYNLT